MKVYIYLFFFTLIGFTLTSCSFSPKEYTEGVNKMDLGYYEEAVDQFKLIEITNTKWRSKGVEKIDNCIDSLFKLQNFTRLKSFAEKHINDTLISKRIISKANFNLMEYINTDFQKGFAYYDSLSVLLLGNDDTRKTILSLEDKAFSGTWRGITSSLNGAEIQFTRGNKSDETNDEFIKGYCSNKTKVWDLNQLIYKDIFYNGDGEFECKVRVFHTPYYWFQSSYSYFTKKAGLIKFIDKDTMLINYEGSVSSNNKVKFVRVDKMDKSKISDSPKSKENNCTVNGDDINVRNQPNVESKSILKINRGEYFKVLEEGPSDDLKGKKGKWKKIKFKEITGWVFDVFIEC